MDLNSHTYTFNDSCKSLLPTGVAPHVRQVSHTTALLEAHSTTKASCFTNRTMHTRAQCSKGALVLVIMLLLLQRNTCPDGGHKKHTNCCQQRCAHIATRAHCQGMEEANCWVSNRCERKDQWEANQGLQAYELGGSHCVACCAFYHCCWLCQWSPV